MAKHLTNDERLEFTLFLIYSMNYIIFGDLYGYNIRNNENVYYQNLRYKWKVKHFLKSENKDRN